MLTNGESIHTLINDISQKTFQQCHSDTIRLIKKDKKLGNSHTINLIELK